MLNNSNSPRALQYSPTTATLTHYRSVASFQEIPPLVSIHEEKHDNNESLQERYSTKKENGQGKSKQPYQKIAKERVNGTLKDKNKIQYNDSKQKQGDPRHKLKNGSSYPSHKIIYKNNQDSISKNLYDSKNTPKAPKATQQSQQFHHFDKYAQNFNKNTNSNGERINTEEEDSVAQSVYLDLEEYSSIHKYQSVLRYNEDQFEQDKQYAKYFNEVPPKLIPKATLQKNSPTRHLPSYDNQIQDPNDTYNLFLDQYEELQPQVKIKRMQSSNPSHYEQIHPRLSFPLEQKHYAAEENHNKSMQKAETQRNDNEVHTHSASAEFNHIQEEENQNMPSSRRMSKMGVSSRFDAYEIMRDLYERNIKHSSNASSRSHIKISESNHPTDGREGQMKKKQSIGVGKAEWISNKSAENILRIILTKSSKLIQFLQFNNELQIYHQQIELNRNIQRIKNRTDANIGNRSRETEGEQSKKQDINKDAKVYYENDGLREKERKANLAESKKQGMPLSKTSSLVFKYTPSQVQEAGRQSEKSRKLQNAQENRSENLNSFNVFANGSKKNKQDGTSLYSIYSEIDAESEYNNQANSNKNGRDAKEGIKEREVLDILALLLIKLSMKKCNFYVKDKEHSPYVEKSRQKIEKQRSKSKERLNEIYKSASPIMNKLRQKQPNPNDYNSNHSNKFTKTPQQEFQQVISQVMSLKSENKLTKIQFEQYLEVKGSKKGERMSSSVKMMTYTEKIRELNEELEKRQKYLYEIKTQYDYVINNYINSIANLQKNKEGNKYEEFEMSLKNRDLESYDKIYAPTLANMHKNSFESLDNPRQSQPMTFQRDNNQNDSREEDQWIGNAYPKEQDEDNNLKIQIRHSLPSKNEKIQN